MRCGNRVGKKFCRAQQAVGVTSSAQPPIAACFVGEKGECGSGEGQKQGAQPAAADAGLAGDEVERKGDGHEAAHGHPLDGCRGRCR